MSFGIWILFVTVKPTVDVVLVTVWWQLAFVYLHNVVIFSIFLKRHIGHLQTVLSLFRNADVTPKLKKRRLITKTVDHPEHDIYIRCHKIASQATEAIHGLKEPTNIAKIWSFLELCYESQNFVSSVMRISAPLNAKLQNDQPASFEPLNKNKLMLINSQKDALLGSLFPTLLITTSHTTLDPDACSVQIGCARQQLKPDGKRSTIENWSRSPRRHT